MCLTKWINNQPTTFCGRGLHQMYKCEFCGRAGDLLCDFPLPEGKKKTCDARMCDRCAIRMGNDEDFCRTHAVELINRACHGLNAGKERSDKSLWRPSTLNAHARFLFGSSPDYKQLAAAKLAYLLHDLRGKIDGSLGEFVG